jgi:hypothetical protein
MIPDFISRDLNDFLPANRFDLSNDDFSKEDLFKSDFYTNLIY